MVKVKERRLLLITDGRFSGATRGFCVGHVGPEAALGGPIALLRNGDMIDIDAKKGTVNVRLTRAQLASRKRKWKARKSEFWIRHTLEICSNCWTSLFRSTNSSRQEKRS